MVEGWVLRGDDQGSKVEGPGSPVLGLGSSVEGCDYWVRCLGSIDKIDSEGDA